MGMVILFSQNNGDLPNRSDDRIESQLEY
jgi:hypothetical protein